MSSCDSGLVSELGCCAAAVCETMKCPELPMLSVVGDSVVRVDVYEFWGEHVTSTDEVEKKELETGEEASVRARETVKESLVLKIVVSALWAIGSLCDMAH